jgi:hypothetical protein
LLSNVFTKFFEGNLSMRKTFLSGVSVLVLLGIAGAVTADDYSIDADHSSVSFKISHLGLSYVHGRFNTFSGGFSLDSSDPAKNSFKLDIKPQSIDTNSPKRDNHLRSPDFFNAKQFATAGFKSTSVKRHVHLEGRRNQGIPQGLHPDRLLHRFRDQALGVGRRQGDTRPGRRRLRLNQL